MIEPAKDLDLSPSRGELYRVADQVEENLAGLALVGPQHRQVRREPDIDREPGLLDRWPADPDHRLDHLSQIEDLFLQFQLAGLGLGHIEYVVDQIEEVRAAEVDVGDVRAILLVLDRSHYLLFHELGEADNRIERRAQLVAHRAEK